MLLPSVCSRLPVAVTPITPGTSTGMTTQAFVTSCRAGSESVVRTSRVLRRMREILALVPVAATTVTPFCCANLIARGSAFQIARCLGSFRQLKSNGSAK